MEKKCLFLSDDSIKIFAQYYQSVQSFLKWKSLVEFDSETA